MKPLTIATLFLIIGLIGCESHFYRVKEISSSSDRENRFKDLDDGGAVRARICLLLYGRWHRIYTTVSVQGEGRFWFRKLYFYSGHVTFFS